MTIKERIELFIEQQGIKRSVFEKSCGFSNGYTRNLKENPSASKIENILSSYPQLNRVWLLTGEGEMLKEVPTNSEISSTHIPQTNAHWIPLIPISAHGGPLSDFIVSVKNSDCEKVLSPIKGADFAIPVTGDSMAPEYPNGSQVHIKKIDETAFIEWGKVYVLDTCNGTVIKRIVPSEKEGYIRCISINPSPLYAPFDVKMEDIYGIYRVMLCLAIK